MVAVVPQGRYYGSPDPKLRARSEQFGDVSRMSLLRAGDRLANFGQDLLHPSWGRFVPAVLVHVGFALFFLGLAHLVLRRKDL